MLCQLYDPLTRNTSTGDERTFLDHMGTVNDEANYQYPHDDLLKITGFCSRADLLQSVDTPVFKRGPETDVTFGTLNGLESRTLRNYRVSEAGKPLKFLSDEWCVIPRRGRARKGTLQGFSARGDSGSIVLNRKGEILGMLTGGLGDLSDVTYFTAWYQLWPHIQQAVPGIRIPGASSASQPEAGPGST